MIKLTKDEIQTLRSTLYDLGNSKLYELCKENFNHVTPDEIIAKTTLIGRSYAVALERGKKKNKTKKEKKIKDINDDFYQKTIVPLFQKSKIDEYLSELARLKSPEGNEAKILHLHWYLTDLLEVLNGEEKRSFSSKYLHFHLPNLFFLYDSRAKSVISKFISRKEVKPLRYKKSDEQYLEFYSKAISLQRKIKSEHNLSLTPREIDNLFLKEANEKLRKKHS